MPNVAFFNSYAECCYAECRIFIVMLSVDMLSVVVVYFKAVIVK
jgi:hypothetical protein